MHKEVLTEKQIKLLPLLRYFSSQFGLVGGTAIALHLGHRRSIDYDLFTKRDFDNESIRGKIRENYLIQKTFVESSNQLTILVNDVRMTFYKYHFDIKYTKKLENTTKLPNLLTLASMKAFTLGKRAKWKDYVDLYFIFKKYSLSEISKRARKIFKGEFNEKLFREQVSFFSDIDYSEAIDYMKGFEIKDDEIKGALVKISQE